MKPLAYQVLRQLAHGEFVPGAQLARAVAMSRTSVWNAAAEIEAAGLDVYRVRGRGYRLARPLTMLDAAAITRHLGEASPFAIEVTDEADSTNTLLMQRAREGAPHASVAAAEWQRAGRGRLDRRWHGELGGALMFSLLWRFSCGAAALAGLSLAAGVAVARALTARGAAEVGLKWPNDVLWRGRKLAGMLIEMQGDALGPSAVVIGVGVNVRLGEAARKRIDQPVSDLETVTGREIDRNALLAAILEEMNRVLLIFEREGFRPLRAEWQSRHVHQNCVVRLTTQGLRADSGIARGVTEEGALLIETARGVLPFHSGDVSVRAAERLP